MATKALVAASSKPMILSILGHGESYGYQIIKKVEELTGGELQWTDAMLYPVLHRMEREGLIESRWVIPENGRKRKYYKLTPLGAESREVEKRQWIKVNDALQHLWSDKPGLALG
ncbi:MAG: helix-turn-helix transcriptional regulator [Bacteroidota bacterium]